MSADFDKAIDGAVRGMLASEPADDVRARVLAAIEVDEKRSPIWMLVPLGAAAALIFFLASPSLQQPPLGPAVPAAPLSAAAGLPGVPTAVSLPPSEVQMVRSVGPTSARHDAVPSRSIDEESPVAALEAIAPIAVEGSQPPDISVERLASPAPPETTGLAVAPMQLKPIEIAPLTQTLPDRQQEEKR